MIRKWGPVNVLDMGATGDGQTDDTDAIQRAINFVYDRGGGTVYFPFTPKGYRIAKPAAESINGFPCRSQLYIPCEPGNVDGWRNLCLEGEMPVRQLYDYQMRAPDNAAPGRLPSFRSASTIVSSSPTGKPLKTPTTPTPAPGR